MSDWLELLLDISKEIIASAIFCVLQCGLQYIIRKIKNHSNANKSGLKNN